MAQLNKLFKNNPDDTIWWVDATEKEGEFVFTFDKKRYFNLFADYPEQLTQEQKRTFDKENPRWAEFFAE